MPDRRHPGAEVFGDPACDECGYEWTTTFEEAIGLISTTVQRYQALLTGREAEAMRKPDPATWSPAGYVWHLSDWFRIQGQRIYAISHDPNYRFVGLGTDPDGLGEIFKYDELSPVGGLWALQKSADLFVEAAGAAARHDLVFRARDGDEWTVDELVVWVGHESVHHELDIKRGLGLA